MKKIIPLLFVTILGCHEAKEDTHDAFIRYCDSCSKYEDLRGLASTLDQRDCATRNAHYYLKLLDSAFFVMYPPKLPAPPAPPVPLIDTNCYPVKSTK